MLTLFDSTTLPHMRLKNRLFRSATCEGLANPDGTLPGSLLQLYQKLAEGGVGAIITGACIVTEDSLDDMPGLMRLHTDSLIPEYARLVDRVKIHNCRLLMQLAIFDDMRLDPQSGHYHELTINELTTEQIQRTVALFAQTAQRAQQAGFDGVQIHAAHGFFLSRFLCPATNHRTDAYGGNTRNRARIILEILNAIRANTKNFHTSIKINFHDFIPNGITPQEATAICKLLELAGIDSIEISANGTSRPGIKPGVNEAYFLEFAQILKQHVYTPIILVGGHRSPENMEKILNQDNIPYFSLSRPLIREPNLPLRWMTGNVTPAACISCNSCYKDMGHCKFA